MVELFGKDKRTISEHIGNIFKDGEHFFATTASCCCPWVRLTLRISPTLKKNVEVINVEPWVKGRE